MKLMSVFNLPIVLSTALLLSISILVIYSSSQVLALQQFIYAVIGFILYLFLSQFDYKSLSNFTIPSYFIVVVALLFVFILGIETRGSTRWITIGSVNIQPSEFAKPIIILLLAHFWSRNSPTWRNIAKSLLIIAPAAGLIFKQPDLGTFLSIMAIWGGMLFAARISFKKILLLVLVGAVILPISWSFLHDYQRQRITSFLSPNSDPLGVGYNIIQSTIAVGSGQLMGRGLGQGTQSRLQFLPEFRTDFIFASITEELGFVGAGLILLIYFFLLGYCLKLAGKAFDGFGFLIVFGVVSMLFFQIIVNVGMNIGVFPITGITLPLISYGGSSLIATFISLGLVASVIRFRRKTYKHMEIFSSPI